jgi:RHS repeat-associated protein
MIRRQAVVLAGAGDILDPIGGSPSAYLRSPQIGRRGRGVVRSEKRIVVPRAQRKHSILCSRRQHHSRTRSRLRTKSFVGTYTYGAGAAGPHALTSIATCSGCTVNGVSNPVYAYDANGNMTSGAGRTVTDNSFNMTASVAQGTTSETLTYGPDHDRLRQISAVGGVTTNTYYFNDPAANVMVELVETAGVGIWKTYIVADGKIVAQRVTAGSTVTMLYFVLDHLGSVAVITDSTGSPTTAIRQFYDAWGAMRGPSGTPDTTCSLPPASPSTRGYTNQEQIPAVCLVNYNARIYDPVIGRFMSADSTVEALYDPQDLNRYSYVGNNPLAFTDPSGMCFLGCFWKQSWFGAVLDIALFFVGLPELEIGFQLGVSAAFGAVSATMLVVNAGIAGGIAGFVSTGKVQGALMGALQGIATVGVAPGIGGALGNTIISNAIAQGLIGGLFSAASGGNFGSGFLAAGVGSLGGSMFGGGQFDPG